MIGRMADREPAGVDPVAAAAAMIQGDERLRPVLLEWRERIVQATGLQPVFVLPPGMLAGTDLLDGTPVVHSWDAVWPMVALRLPES